MTAQRVRSEPVDSLSLWATLGKPVLLILGLTIAGIVLRETDGVFHSGVLDRSVVGQGLLGKFVFVLAGAAACAAGMPRQAVAFGASYAFGLWAGAALSLLAQTIGCVMSFGWARALGRGWASRRMRGRLARLDRFLAMNPFAATLVLRLLPVGNSLALNLLAGLSAVPLRPFLAASIVGFVPQTLIFALLGGGVRINETSQIGIAVLLFIASAMVGVWLLRGQRQLANFAIEDERS